MGLITKVKAGSVSSLSDARYFSGMGVDWLGFDLNPISPHYVNPVLYQNIAGWVSGPKRVIELPPEVSKESLTQLIEVYQPDAVEISIDQLEVVKPATKLSIIVKVDLDATQSLSSSLITHSVDFILVDSKNPMAIRSRLEQLNKIAPLLLSIQSDTNNAKELLANLPLAGVSLNGTVETKVGEKEYPFAELLESLEED